MNVNINDFRFMRNGESPLILQQSDRELLNRVEIHGINKKCALLMLHGFSSTPAVFRQIIPNIKKYDAIIAPVLPGHAQSIKEFAKVKHTDWLTKVEAECEVLLKEYEQVDVMGLSMGGLLACHLAARYPINHLYLLAPALDLYLSLDRTLRLLKIFKKLGFKGLTNSGANILSPTFRDISYRKIPLNSIIEIMTLVKNFQFTPPICPTDLFIGKYDEVVDSRKVATRFLPYPQVSLHWLEKSAHVLSLDADLAKIITCLNKDRKTINQKTTVSNPDNTP